MQNKQNTGGLKYSSANRYWQKLDCQGGWGTNYLGYLLLGSKLSGRGFLYIY